MPALAGLYTPIITPFRNDTVDDAAIRRNVERYMQTRLTGLVVLGSIVVAVLGLDAGPHAVVVQLRGPDGRPAMQHAPEMTVHSSGDSQDVNVIVELNNLSFASYGEYRFDLDVDGETVESLAVSIMQMGATPGGRRAN